MLERQLRDHDKKELLEVLQQTNMESGKSAYVWRDQPLDLSHAVWRAHRLNANGSFAVYTMVGKPANDMAPFNLAIIGRYILNPNILSNLSRTRTSLGAEVKLTNAILAEIEISDNVYSYRFDEQRFACRTKARFLRTTVAFALA